MMIHLLVRLLDLMTMTVSVRVEKSVGVTRTHLSLLALLMIMVGIVVAVECVFTHRTRRLIWHITSATLTMRRSLSLILLSLILSHPQTVLLIPILMLSPLSVQRMMIPRNKMPTLANAI